MPAGRIRAGKKYYEPGEEAENARGDLAEDQAEIVGNTDVDHAEEKAQDDETPADLVRPRHFELHRGARSAREEGRVAVDEVPQRGFEPEGPVLEADLE